MVDIGQDSRIPIVMDQTASIRGKSILVRCPGDGGRIVPSHAIPSSLGLPWDWNTVQIENVSWRSSHCLPCLASVYILITHRLLHQFHCSSSGDLTGANFDCSPLAAQCTWKAALWNLCSSSYLPCSKIFGYNWCNESFERVVLRSHDRQDWTKYHGVMLELLLKTTLVECLPAVLSPCLGTGAD